MADQLDGINPLTNRPRCEESIGKYWLPNLHSDAEANGIAFDVVEKISERDFVWWDSQSLAFQEGILKNLDKVEYPINYMSCVLTHGNKSLGVNKDQHSTTRSRWRAWQSFLDDHFESTHEIEVKDLTLYTKDYHGQCIIDGIFSIQAYDDVDVGTIGWFELDKLNEN